MIGGVDDVVAVATVDDHQVTGRRIEISDVDRVVTAETVDLNRGGCS